MADTRVQYKVEDWVRRNWMPQEFGQEFARERLELKSGGVFDFDAVSRDQRIIACISTGAGITNGGKYPTSKVQKLRSDMYFLLLASAERRILCVTARDMFDIIEKERAAGRLAPGIEFFHVPLPEDLEVELTAARARAALESKPRPPSPKG